MGDRGWLRFGPLCGTKLNHRRGRGGIRDGSCGRAQRAMARARCDRGVDDPPRGAREMPRPYAPTPCPIHSPSARVPLKVPFLIWLKAIRLARPCFRQRSLAFSSASRTGRPSAPPSGGAHGRRRECGQQPPRRGPPSSRCAPWSPRSGTGRGGRGRRPRPFGPRSLLPDRPGPCASYFWSSEEDSISCASSSSSSAKERPKPSTESSTLSTPSSAASSSSSSRSSSSCGSTGTAGSIDTVR